MLKTNKLIALLLSTAFLVGLAFRITLSHLSIKNLPPSSDDALAQLLAESISKGESLPLLFTGQPYQFPVEAYLMSIFVEFFEPGAFAARIQLIVLAAITLIILCVIAVKLFKSEDRWPTLILLLIPSAYWLLHQSAYFVPQYTISALFAALIFYLAITINQSEDSSLIATLICGIICGVAISNHLLMLSVVIGAVAIIVIGANLRHSLVRAGLLIAAIFIGLIPYLLAVFTIQGAYDAIASRTDLGILFTRLYDVVISQALPGAMGLYPPYYPDYPVHISWGIPLRLLLIAGFLFILLFCCAIRTNHFFNNLNKDSWRGLGWPDMFIIVSMVSLLLMAVNTQSQVSDHRYLLPVVWSFPFLLGYLYCVQKLKWLITGYCVFLIVVNTFTSIDIFKAWSQPEKIQYYADTQDIDQTVTWMENHNIEYCYATFWLAYRFTYETDKKIICAPVYNERFNGWPIPYKKQVDAAKRVAFIMSNTFGTKFSATKFETIMQQYEIEYQRRILGEHYIYSDFSYQPAFNEKSLSEQHFEVVTNLANVEATALIDKNVMKAWNMNEHQQTGQTVDLKFMQEQFVQRIDIVHPLDNPYPAKSINVWGQVKNEWIQLVDDIEFKVDRLRFENNHPIFGEFLQTIRFEPIWLDAVRIELATPEPGKPWTLSEIRVGIKTSNASLK